MCDELFEEKGEINLESSGILHNAEITGRDVIG